MTGDALTAQVAALLDDALAAAPDAGARTTLAAARARLDEPLRVAIAGKVKAGKSTLLNALAGQELAPTDAGECTRVVTWYRDSHTYRVLLHPRAGEPVQRPFRKEGGAVDVDLGPTPVEEVDHLEVWWPSERLREHTLIDTPGIASISIETSARTEELLAHDETRPAAADAVLYLLRHLHSTDVRFLESFHDDALARATPITSIGILSRADEIGSCRLDAMETAERVADRYEADPQIRRLCSTVLPVAGLLAQAGATLREEEFRALATVAAAPVAEASALLLTADRFGRSPTGLDLPEALRQRLLARLGLCGVRLGERLIRTGAAGSATDLAAELVRRSGLHRLRSALVYRFGSRGRVLKARSALVALRVALETPGWADAERLRREAERVAAGAHELTEVRLLNELYAGRIPVVDEERRTEIARLLGAEGDEPASRLGLPEDSTPADLRSAAVAALRRWQHSAEHPLSDQGRRTAARTVVRSCEGILARLALPARGAG